MPVSMPSGSKSEASRGGSVLSLAIPMRQPSCLRSCQKAAVKEIKKKANERDFEKMDDEKRALAEANTREIQVAPSVDEGKEKSKSK